MGTKKGTINSVVWGGVPELRCLTWALRMTRFHLGMKEEKGKEVQAERRVGKGKGPVSAEPGQEAVSSLV